MFHILYAFGTIFFNETFSDSDRWTTSYWKGEDSSDFIIGKGSFYADEIKSNAFMTNESARFYTSTSSFDAFENSQDYLYVHYTVKHEQVIDCGGGYLKMYPPLDDLSKVQGGVSETPYNIMFGPDICGESRKVHFILNYNGTNYENKKKIECPRDTFTHMFDFSLMNGGQYDISIDNISKASGMIKEDFDFLEPEEINDPEVKKPNDWIDDPEMDDLNDKKPDEWDEIPAQIPDPDASIPEDWNAEDDGEWEAPLISNPDFKGEWKPRRISNPDYKGVWNQPKIKNPKFIDDDNMGNYTFGAIGFEIWQVKAGSAFDSILVTNDYDEFTTSKSEMLSLITKEKEAYEEMSKESKDKELESNSIDLKDEV